MPCRYQIVPEVNLVAKAYFGRVTTECILKLLDSIEADCTYHEGMIAFDDLSRVEYLDVSSRDISNFAALLSGFGYRRQRPSHMVVFAPHGAGRAGALEFLRRVEGSQTLNVSVVDTLSKAATLLGFAESVKLERILATV